VIDCKLPYAVMLHVGQNGFLLSVKK